MANHLEGSHDKLMNAVTSDNTIPVSRTPSSNAANGTLLNPTATHQENKQDASHKNTQLTQLLASPPRTGGSAVVGVGNISSSSVSAVTSSPLHNQLSHPSGANSNAHLSNAAGHKLIARQRAVAGNLASTKQTVGMSTVTNTVSSLAMPNTVVSFKNNPSGLNAINIASRANYSGAGPASLVNMPNVQNRHSLMNGPLTGPGNGGMPRSSAPTSMAMPNSSNVMVGQQMNSPLSNVIGSTHALNQVNQQQTMAKVSVQYHMMFWCTNTMVRFVCYPERRSEFRSCHILVTWSM